MMKFINYFCLLTPLFGLSNCTPTKTISGNQQPKIKTIKSMGYAAKFEGQTIEKAFYLYEYDKRGNIIKQDSYDKNGTLKSQNLYKYDEQGHQIESNFYTTSTRINSYSKSEYIYDKNDNIKIKYHESGNQYRPKKQVYKTTFSYKNGNLIEEIKEETWLGKPSTTKRLYSYNKLNAIDTIFEYIDNDYLYKKTIYQYNEKGILLDYQNIKYPKGGNPAYIKQYKKYDEAGNIILKISEIPNELFSKEIYEYNSVGLKIKYQKIEKDEIIINETYEYQLDKHRNWIFSKTFSFGKADWITKREIQYYE